MTTHDHDLYDLGLAADLAMFKRSPMDRRRILKMGALGIGVLLAGCGTSASTATSPTSAAATGATSGTSATGCVGEIPQETAGPYPADGSNASNQTLNALALAGIARSDIRTSLGTKNVAPGIPTQIILTLVNSKDNCTPLANYAVYLWHCNRDGNYSLYSNGVTSEDYLRGVQTAASDGKVTFTSIFPACYAGRWPHIHFEIYSSVAQATAGSNAIHTSQLALPADVCQTVYATDGYSASVKNVSQISLTSDNVFGDGSSLQVASAAGDVTSGYTVQLTVGVAV